MQKRHAVRVLITAGTTADCRQVVALIDGFTAKYVLTCHICYTHELIEKAITAEIQIAAAPKKSKRTT